MDGAQITSTSAGVREPTPADELEQNETESLAASVSPSDTSVRRRNPWGRRALSVGVVVLIAATIWYLQSERSSSTVSDVTSVQDAGGGADAVAGSGFVSFQTQGIKLGARGGPAPKIGQPAPDFALLDRGGKVVQLSDFRGKVVVMNFWATWCGPCRKEFPELVKLHDGNAERGLVVLGVDLQENAAIVGRFADEFGATFPIVIDRTGDVGAQYRLLGLPLTMFIDRDGVLRAQQIGELSADVLSKKLSDTGFTVTKR